METFRHRCGAQSSKLVDGREVVGRFDSYTFPPSLDKMERSAPENRGWPFFFIISKSGSFLRDAVMQGTKKASPGAVWMFKKAKAGLHIPGICVSILPHWPGGLCPRTGYCSVARRPGIPPHPEGRHDGSRVASFPARAVHAAQKQDADQQAFRQGIRRYVFHASCFQEACAVRHVHPEGACGTSFPGGASTSAYRASLFAKSRHEGAAEQ